MHSSRMRTGRSLTVCRSLLPSGVSGPGVREGCLVPGVGGVWSQGVGAVCSRKVSGPQVGVWSRGCMLLGTVCSGGCLLLGGGRGRGVWSWGVSNSGGCLLPGDLPREVGCGIPACTEADTPCEQNDKLE